MIVDRFSGLPVIERCCGSVGELRDLMRALQYYFDVYGVPEEMATNGGSVFMSVPVKQSLLKFALGKGCSALTTLTLTRSSAWSNVYEEAVYRKCWPQQIS